MRFFAMLILLAFPLAEIFLLVKLGHQYGWWLGLYLVVISLLGLQLIKDERSMFSARMMQSLSAGGNPVTAMMGSARNMVAGVLLLIPGVITDAIAALLLLIPVRQPALGAGQTYQEQPYRAAANDDIIEGEFTEIKNELEKK
ncbi:MAG TPA: FxsA family protein [Methylophilus sp.]|nr:FxsA family protein [Methylophilus sp.]HQQ32305.1 FxsA family protein [Methylophilus sp.]